MEVDRRKAQHIVALANLYFSEKDLKRFTDQMNRILEYMERLNELDTSRIEPTFYSLEEGDEVFREDRVRPSIPPEEALKNAPEADQGHFRVPRILS